MPLFYQHTINEFSRLGIWKIEETEVFFSQTVPLQRDISHPHKRLQHLAGRYLLQFLFPDFPYELIKIADTRKPFLSNEAYHFSISHCGDFAAAIVSKLNRVGVDIELIKPMIQKVKLKFLSEKEIQLLSENMRLPNDVGKTVNSHSGYPPSDLLTLSWSAKEAMFKWYGNSGVDFKNHMQLISTIDFTREYFIQSTYLFSKEEQVRLNVSSKIFGDLVVSYVIS
ncbi:MAG: 4'-phosphopantetheinyl transferase superfamily protein [Chitinophagaceae bacterium]